MTLWPLLLILRARHLRRQQPIVIVTITGAGVDITWDYGCEEVRFAG